MKLAIVGSTSLAGNPEAQRLIEDILDRYRPAVVVSGGAPGIDTMAEEAATRHGIPTSIWRPAYQAWPAFKARNLLIAEECDMLIRIVDSKSQTYGSGWTRDRAKEMGKPTEEYLLYEVDGRQLVLGGDRIMPA